MADDAQGLFGARHERLATLVGLVAMHAALLESNIESLAASVGDVRQDESAGIGFAGAASVIRKTLAESYASDEQGRFRGQVFDLLDRVDVALRRRNLIVHGVWSVKQPGVWSAWKPRRTAKSTADWIESATFGESDFAEVLASLRQLHHDAMTALNAAAAHERVRSEDGRGALRSKSSIAPGRAG